MTKRTWLASVGVLVLIAATVLSAGAQQPGPQEPLSRADELFEQKNYQEAAELYEAALETKLEPERVQHAYEHIILCRLRLRLFDDALEAAEQFVKRTSGTYREARARRQAGNLYMLIPHWGTRAGGEFFRGEWKQGIQLRSEKHDKRLAVAHLERARDLYAAYDLRLASGKGVPVTKRPVPKEEREAWHGERIECIFDLANCLSRFSIYENDWRWWHRWWGERDEFIAETAGEEDFDEYHSDSEMRRKRPIGLRVDEEGNPIFPTAPKDYSGGLSDDRKILYLLAEVRALDSGEEGKFAALSYYRQAMLARARFGMDRINGYAGMYWWGGKAPLQEELGTFNPWELADDETLALAGGRVRKVTLPEEFDVLGLLRVVADYPKSGIAGQAHYAVGLYYQTRQQYKTALGEYEAVKKAHPGTSQWARNADAQIGRIKAPQARLSDSGVQLPGEPARLEVSYRNTSKLHFVARSFDHKAFFEEVRATILEDPGKRNAPYVLGNWTGYLMYKRSPSDWDHWVGQIAAKHVGPEVARWTDEVPDDGSHRYAHTTLQTPLDGAGAYLVHAYLKAPPKEHAEKGGMDVLALGDSRAVVVLTDMAIVEKKTSKGNLYFIADARGGAPVPGATIDILETWSTYDHKLKRSIYHAAMHNLITDKQGMAVFPPQRPQQSQLHLLVSAGAKRLAWTGMTYTSRYHPSRMRDGMFAYVITDRPVYRPEQTVRYKVWLRRMLKGNLNNMPAQSVSITIYDPRGNKVLEETQQTDQFGGLDGRLTLGEEPPLGVYRIHVRGQKYAGGQNFRVEEYKKPEFEVTVEPGKTHAKLGDKLTAVIRAKYYFGAPVTDATVSYKIFREEYRHAYYFPGRWDWLYGRGYGYSWYDYDWFPWWGALRSCRVAPPWWWYPARTPVRELVEQGTGRIGEDGTLKVEIDTRPALREHGDLDHRYVIQAEVRDASRRVISGEGAVKVTRQAYYAFIQSDRGYYAPGQEMRIIVRCLTPDNKPVQTEGIVTVSRVVYGGPDNARIEETELKRWKASTDKRGILKFPLRHERSDQLKIRFEAPDEWGGKVEGYGLVWVCGRDFDGRLYRFNDLELLTDKRTYKPGEVCHLMINTKRPGSYVLFSDDVDSNHLLSWRLLHLPKRSTIVDIPITKDQRPNFFVEATTVADARVHQQMKRICVPPEKGILKVSVKTDKPSYRPGEKASVTLTARTLGGKPARAQITLSAFDKSVLYIQPEYTEEIRKFFHGRMQHHGLRMLTNLLERFGAVGYVHRPFQQLQLLPPDWYGTWGPVIGDWRTVDEKELRDLAAICGDGGRRGYGGWGGEARFRMAKSETLEGFGEAREAPAGGVALDVSASGPAGGYGGTGGEPAFAEAEVRQKFADTALWLTTLTTDENGEATATVEMPENLTTWKINSWAMTKATRVGQASAEAVTTKDLIVRLQAPRFFMEHDEVVLSANVHNYLDEEKDVRVDLLIDGGCIDAMDNPSIASDSTKVHTVKRVKVPAGAERRVDWRVKVVKEGMAGITVKALTDEESDAMKMSFPVLVHGMTKQVAQGGSMRPDELEATQTIELFVPEERRPELTRLEVQYSPSLVGAMLDALPYSLYYPYGCAEQTMSRFLPAVLTLKTIQNMGITLEELEHARGKMAEIRRIEKGERISIYSHIDNPVFDAHEMNRIIDAGLQRITGMQHGDGGWGWWKEAPSSGYMTGYVLNALITARQCDLEIDENMIQRGTSFLKGWEEGEMRETHWSPHAQHAFVAYVLSMRSVRAAIKPADGDERPGDLLDRLYEGRDKLNLYGKALLSMALAGVGDEDRARIVLRNILQYKEENPETEIAWFRTPSAGWWYWWNSDIETNAWCLRALIRLEPKSPLAPKIVKWLLENRKNGYYWRSTRDTTFCLAAMSDFVVASGEGRPDYTLTIELDGKVTKTVKIDRDNFFTYDNRFVIEGVALGGGTHTLKITKKGKGALYWSSYLTYFTKEEDIKAAGRELKVQRRYYRLVQIPYEVEVEGARGQKLIEKRLRYERVPIASGDRVESGDLIQIELEVESDNNYTYLVFEDMKAAGCEPVEVRSGGKRQEGFYSYMELRDEKVAFFLRSIDQGKHLLRYRVRAEVPGVFHALPAVLYGMYVPELRGNSDELVVGIEDK